MQKHIKICFVQAVQSPYNRERLKILAQHNDLDIILLLEREGLVDRPLWQTENIEGLHVTVLGSAAINSSMKNNDLAYRTKGLRLLPLKLPTALRLLKPDIVVLCNATQVLFSLIARRIVGFRIALMVEDTPHATNNLSWLMKKLKAFTYRQADKFYVLSKDAQLYLEHIGINSEIQYMPWSLDMNSFKRDTTVEYRKLHILPRKKNVVFVGRLIPLKGINLLLEAWATLSESILARTKLILAGDGPLRQQAEGLCKTHNFSDVVFLGNIPHEQVKTLLKEADLFVLPTLQDVYSLSVLEAMASGCPVIITPFAGSRELVDHGCNGWIVDPTIPGALKSILEEALSDQANLPQMGIAARKRVEHMDNKTVMGSFAESLRKLAATPS